MTFRLRVQLNQALVIEPGEKEALSEGAVPVLYGGIAGIRLERRGLREQADLPLHGAIC